MNCSTTVRWLLCVATLCLGPSAARAQDWAEKMFERNSLDFGVVARGADVRYRLALTNKYVETVHISGVRTSCGCASARSLKDTLASRETTYIEVSMDTRRFQGDKNSNVIVTFDAPFYAEVRIPVHSYIRTDVVLTPGGVEFGSLPKGSEVSRTVQIAYAGRENWSIREVVSRNPNISARIQETARGGGRVNYDLFVTVKPGAPIGDLREQLTLLTDDANSPQIPVLVEGRIEAEFQVNPEVVSFGLLNPGERKTVNVVVRGRKPFAIEGIESDKTSGVFEVRLPKDTKPIHVLPLTVIAPNEPGPLDESFTVTITGLPAPIQFKAFGKVAGPATAPVSTTSPVSNVAPVQSPGATN